jgi:hypothetical protein
MPFGYLFRMPVQGHQGPLVCFLDFLAEGGGVGDQVSGYTTTVDVQTVLFEHVPEICLFQ